MRLDSSDTTSLNEKDSFNLTKKLIARNRRRQFWLTFFASFIALHIVSFLCVRFVYDTTLASIFQSQSAPIADQEWRWVKNGIKSGWRLPLKITNLCIVHQKIVVTQEGSCQAMMEPWVKGTWLSSIFGVTQLRIKLAYPLWVVSSAIACLVLVPLFIFVHLITLPLKSRAQYEMISIISNETKPLSSHQKLIKDQTDELLRLRKMETIANTAQMLAHDLRPPLKAIEKLISIRSWSEFEGTRNGADFALGRIS